jgi:hypothetical protein
MRLDDVLDLLRKRCADAGSLTAFAEAHDLDKQYVSQVLNGHRPPSERVCVALGIRYDGGRWIKS